MFSLSFDPPGVGLRLATVLIDRSDEDVNLLRPVDLDRLDAVFDAIEGETDVTAIVIRSGKPGCFLAGVDVDTVADATDRRDIEAFVRRGAELFLRVSRSSRPVVCAIEGVCTGAGLELALACDVRVCADSASTLLGLPEIELGLFPAGGALVRLPGQVGLSAALDLVLSGRRIRPRKAKQLSLVDVVVRREALLHAARAEARRWVADVSVRPKATVLWRSLAERNPVARRRAFKDARAAVQARSHGLDPAPLAALDVMERSLGLPLQRALRLAPAAFAELAVGDVARARMSLFAESKRLRHTPVLDADGRPARPRELGVLGVLGGGVMGADVAAVAAAEAGLRVRIREKGPDALGKALQRVHSQLQRAASAGSDTMLRAWRARVSGGLDLRGFETMDFVLEAVPEELTLKQRVFAELERRVRPDAILASHTRALPISEIGARVRRRDRLLGLHVFRPVAKMRLCEIVRTDETSPEALATALSLSRRLGKTPVVVRDAPGFFTTRVLAFYLMAALELLMEGHALEAIDEGTRRVGWPIGPLELLDDLGLDVGVRVSRIMAAAFPGRARLLPPLESLVGAGRLGRSAGRGFYLYPSGERRRPDPQLWETLGLRGPTRTGDPEELGDRLTLIAALEAVRCLQEGIIARPSDGDVAAVLGLGYPAHRGGPFRHLCARGLSSLRTRLRALQDRFGPRYEAPRLLEELAGRGQDFTWLEARP